MSKVGAKAADVHVHILRNICMSRTKYITCVGVVHKNNIVFPRKAVLYVVLYKEKRKINHFHFPFYIRECVMDLKILLNRVIAY